MTSFGRKGLGCSGGLRASKAGAKSGRQCSGGSLDFAAHCTVSDLFVNKRIACVRLAFLPLFQLCRDRRREKWRREVSSRPEGRGFWTVTGPAEPHTGGAAAVTLTGAAAQAVATVEGKVALRAPPTLFGLLHVTWDRWLLGCHQSSGQEGSWSWQGFPPLASNLRRLSEYYHPS